MSTTANFHVYPCDRGTGTPLGYHHFQWTPGARFPVCILLREGRTERGSRQCDRGGRMSEPTAWTCPICGQSWPVQSIARDCEAKCREIVWAERGGHPNGVMNADMHSYGSGGQHG